MKRFQPASQIRGEVLMHLIMDSVTSKFLPGEFRSHSCRDSVMFRMNKAMERASDHSKISPATKGKCMQCEVIHVWPRGRGRLRNAKCPFCLRNLAKTSRSSPLKLISWPNHLETFS